MTVVTSQVMRHGELPVSSRSNPATHDAWLRLMEKAMQTDMMNLLDQGDAGREPSGAEKPASGRKGPISEDDGRRLSPTWHAPTPSESVSAVRSEEQLGRDRMGAATPGPLHEGDLHWRNDAHAGTANAAAAAQGSGAGRNQTRDNAPQENDVLRDFDASTVESIRADRSLEEGRDGASAAKGAALDREIRELNQAMGVPVLDAVQAENVSELPVTQHAASIRTVSLPFSLARDAAMTGISSRNSEASVQLTAQLQGQRLSPSHVGLGLRTGGPGQEGGGQHELPESSAPSRRAQDATGKDWQKRNMHLMSHKEGVDVWIRDVEIAPHASLAVVQQIAADLASSATPLRWATVNGRLVYAARDRHGEQPFEKIIQKRGN